MSPLPATSPDAGGATALDASLDLGDLGLEHGASLLVKRALARLAVGARLAVAGTDPSLAVHLRAWCRGRGHAFEADPAGAGHLAGVVVRGSADDDRWQGSERAG
ncbi:MAG: sulfurtransferase TusA family protein, partial [Acidimicrobiales bacterium]